MGSFAARYVRVTNLESDIARLQAQGFDDIAVGARIAMALSAWIYGERLTHAQIWSAGILLIGAFLAMRVKPVDTTEAAENI